MKKNILASGLLFATVVTGSIGYGMLATGSNPIWKQDGNNVSTIEERDVTVTGDLALSKDLNLTATNGNGTTTVAADFFSIGGVDYASVQQDFTGATTTPCSIQNPWGNASTSILAYIMQITVGTTTGTTLDVGTSTDAYATTTNLIPAIDTSSASTTTNTWSPSGVGNNILAPTEWINVVANDAGLGGYTFTGTCSALFMKP